MWPQATHLAVKADDTVLRVRFILTAFHHNNNIKEVGSWKENTLKEKKKTLKQPWKEFPL